MTRKWVFVFMMGAILASGVFSQTVYREITRSGTPRTWSF